jgi:hypothetical protein
MVRQSHGGAGGGGGPKSPSRHNKRDEFVQQPRRERVSSTPARTVDPPTFGPKVDLAAVAATKRQAAKLGIPFCEECAKAMAEAPKAQPAERSDLLPDADAEAIATVLRQAAEQGVPFCEECAKRSAGSK